jgi:PPM family protein phosphatase
MRSVILYLCILYSSCRTDISRLRVTSVRRIQQGSSEGVASNSTQENATPEYRVGTRTDIGLRRKRNEDFLGIEKTPVGLLLVVCDGMGGHVGGERASRLAVETFIALVRGGSGDPDTLLRSALKEANQVVYEESRRTPDLKGMGTTLVAALVSGDRATVLNLGDSRAYHLRGGRLVRISNDHSLVGELVAQGRITEQQARVHPQRNIITQALGLDPGVTPDIYHVDLRDGDALLLCSDGLYGMVEDREIERIVKSGGTPERSCDGLIGAALDGGGDDNISVALLYAGGTTKAARLVAEPNTLDPNEQNEGRRSNKGLTLWLLFALAIGIGGGFLYQRSVEQDEAALADSVSSGDSSMMPALRDTTSQITPGDLVDSLDRIDSSTPGPRGATTGRPDANPPIEQPGRTHDTSRTIDSTPGRAF